MWGVLVEPTDIVCGKYAIIDIIHVGGNIDSSSKTLIGVASNTENGSDKSFVLIAVSQV